MSDRAAGRPWGPLVASWAARVRANREQAERVREAPGGGDFYAPVTGLFVVDPRRSGDTTLDALLDIARPGETWLDIGAGAGRYALPLALHVGKVMALDPSIGMLDALRGGMERHRIHNVRPVLARWPFDPAATAAPAAASGADVALIAHLGYDVEAIEPFLDAMEAAAGRLCVAVLADPAPSAPAGPFWPVVHGEERVELPALDEFLAILRARGRDVRLTDERRQQRGYASRDELQAWLRNQLFVVAGSAADGRLADEIGRRAGEAEDGSLHLVPAMESRIAIASWAPRS